MYASKDDKNTATPKYIAVMDAVQYNSLVAAQNAISANGGVAGATNELAALELARIGYVIVQNNVNGGIIEDVIPDKKVITSQVIGAHTHDDLYFRESEHLNTSAGAGDAGKPIILDADGNVDATMINDADIDHVNIGSIGTNTHAQIDTHIAAANPHSSSAASGSNSDITAFTNLTGNISDGTDTVTVAKLAGATKGIATVTFDGQGSALTTGAKKVYLEVPYDGTITAVRLLADQSGSAVVDIWKDTYANFPDITVADTITAAAKPTLSAAQKSEDETLSGWTTSITRGDILEFNIDSVSTITKLILHLDIDKTGV
jgi:hypothetical protein